ncbi:MAG: CpsB/CapC family capsule biosynthesis tyrosine phosphatase [Bacteroidota bacterium]|nr:CpsB/CapC family capsule biosynthesis tyrosine phosphatase [Bacteroidota bacterium]
MGLFSLHKKQHQPVIPIRTDMHSHLLPGIDDGAQTVEESLDMVRAFQAQGYTKIITTPHVHSQRYLNSTDDIMHAREILFDAMEKENINFPVEIAAEYYADEHLLKLLENDDILSFGDNYLLCEFSFLMPPVGTDIIVKEIKNAGYIPVLAHPERYEYWNDNFSMYERLRKQEFLFQANLPSVYGLYGPGPKITVEMLAKKGWVDFLGSDAHDAATVDLLNEITATGVVQNIILHGIRNHNL